MIPIDQRPGAAYPVSAVVGSFEIQKLDSGLAVWQYQTMPRKGISKDHDFAVTARSVLEQVIGERLDGTPLEPAKPTNPKLTERARKGGVVGGRARASKLSAERRSEIARKAANARWKQ